MMKRAIYGALGGLGGTVALSGLRQGLARAGLVQKTAPEQVVDRLDELGLTADWPPEARRALAVAAHLAYGVGTGAVLGLLRRRRGGVSEEAAVGSALALLAWGAGWSTWLPLAGVHEPPWEQETPRVLLPVLDHAVFGAVWALIYRAQRRDPV
ncbi:MAG TPA: hypothetical protein VKA51_12275 [Rubrobacteraceae bacterium]|nr:hypothetical protein [Rubrobacteraceae bacterium]